MIKFNVSYKNLIWESKKYFYIFFYFGCKYGIVYNLGILVNDVEMSCVFEDFLFW